MKWVTSFDTMVMKKIKSEPQEMGMIIQILDLDISIHPTYITFLYDKCKINCIWYNSDWMEVKPLFQKLGMLITFVTLKTL